MYQSDHPPSEGSNCDSINGSPSLVWPRLRWISSKLMGFLLTCCPIAAEALIKRRGNTDRPTNFAAIKSAGCKAIARILYTTNLYTSRLDRGLRANTLIIRAGAGPYNQSI